MPEVYVHAAKDRTVEQKRAIVKEITDVIARNYQVAPEAVLVRLYTDDPESKAKGGVLFADR
jgi:4-oxalocrotonate tautomerase